MRLLQMLGVAAQAEGIRLRRELRGTAVQAGWLAGAAVFGLAAIACAHIAAMAYFTPRHGLAAAAGLVTVADLVIAGVIAAMASRRRRDPVAEEALALRRTTMAAALSAEPVRDAVKEAVRTVTGPLLGMIATEGVLSWIRRRR